MSRQIQLLCAWCGPLFVALIFIGMVPLAEFIPPPPPTDSAVAIRDFYLNNLSGIRLGMILGGIGFSLMAPWGVAVAMQTLRIEKGSPILSYIQIACVAGGSAAGVLDMLIWAVAAFRPDDVAPELTRMLNDTGWFVFLFYWAPFSVWFIAFGLAVMGDTGAPPIFPRWSAYLSFWSALIFAPAGLIVFFKTGPFAFNGLLAFYIPVAAFFIWCLIISALSIKAINREVK